MDKFILAALLSALSLVWVGIARADDTPPVHMAPTVHHAAHVPLTMPELIHCTSRPLDAGTAGATVQVCEVVVGK